MVVFGLASSEAIEEETLQGMVLQLGDGLHPLQWITANFLHGDFWHLLGNMAFLWAFGLVVEGKVGWLWFLCIYLGIGVAESGIEQIVFLGASESAAFGASGIVFGLMAMSMVWAPENEIQLFYWIAWRMGSTSIRIRTLCVLYLLLEGALFLMGNSLGFESGSSVFHLVGALVGFPLGAALLKWDLVDCEGWDLFTLWNKKRLPRAGRRKETATAPAPDQRYFAPAPSAEAPPAQALLDPVPADLPSERDLLARIQACQKDGRWLDLIPDCKDYLNRFSGKAPAVRLLLGKAFIEAARRPASGLDALEAIQPAALSPAQESLRQKLIEKAHRLIDEGVIEFDEG